MSYVRAKRILDISLALAGLLVGAPLWLLIAGAIALLEGRPVLYRGRRMGLDGKVFGMYKFRTMRVGADGAGPGITSSADPRVTPLGRCLRSTKLDELPQLLNVISGEMSLVGPRPEDPRYLPHYTDAQREVLSVPPGITGPSQIRYRHEERLLHAADFEREYRDRLLPAKLALDLEYVRNRSLSRDVRLILTTFSQLVSGDR